MRRIYRYSMSVLVTLGWKCTLAVVAPLFLVDHVEYAPRALLRLGKSAPRALLRLEKKDWTYGRTDARPVHFAYLLLYVTNIKRCPTNADQFSIIFHHRTYQSIYNKMIN